MRTSLFICVAFIVGCARDFAEPQPFACPTVPVEDFRYVSSVLERRCGSLDCHGDLARPLRIMGSNGLRLFTPEQFDSPAAAQEAGVTPGGLEATTELELEQNRESLCGVEPELTEQVVIGNVDPTELMIIKKPSLRERHKGAQVFFKGGAGEACTASWLRGAVSIADCIEAVQSP